MIQIKITGRDKKKAEQHAQVLGDLCDVLKKSNRSYLTFMEILGPIEAPLSRIAKQYRWQIILKGLRVKPLHRFVHQLIFENPSILNNRNVKVVVDVDPLFMM
jgi:primosomal protein N' (replication factor Y)